MIILPPEERKPSPILKWTFRILLVIVIFFCMILFALNILSGTSDAHRHGLEQAMSDMFKGKVTIGTLNSFNVFPQFYIDMKDVRGAYGADGGEFQAEHVILAFSFMDIVLKKKTIEDVQISNLIFTPGIVGAEALQLTKAGIVPANDTTPPYFAAVATYGAAPFTLKLDLNSVMDGARPNYRIDNGNAMNLTLGDFSADGKFLKTDLGETALSNAVFKLKGQEIATGQVTLKNQDNAKMLVIDFMGRAAEGRVSFMPSRRQQTWTFDHLDLASILAEKPVWAELYQASHAIAVSQSTAYTVSGETLSVTIKSLTGALTGENLQGHFKLMPDEIVGWWDGHLSALPDAKKKLPDAGKVQCGLLHLVPKDKAWGASISLTRIDPVMIKSKLVIHTAPAKIDFAVDRVAHDTDEAFGADLGTIAKGVADLQLPQDHACKSLLDDVQVPSP